MAVGGRVEAWALTTPSLVRAFGEQGGVLAIAAKRGEEEKQSARRVHPPAARQPFLPAERALGSHTDPPLEMACFL
jgi:hypothetical protein